MTKLIQFASGDEASSVVHSLGHIRDLGLVRSGRVKYSHVEVTLPEKNKTSREQQYSQRVKIRAMFVISMPVAAKFLLGRMR